MVKISPKGRSTRDVVPCAHVVPMSNINVGFKNIEATVRSPPCARWRGFPLEGGFKKTLYTGLTNRTERAIIYLVVVLVKRDNMFFENLIRIPSPSHGGVYGLETNPSRGL